VNPLPTTTSVEAVERAAQVAVLPIGSFEQHGRHLPLTTDTLVACAIADAVAKRYEVLLLPPITISCSHEHADFVGTVSISAVTLFQVIKDVQASLEHRGVHKLVLVNGHGGNYVLNNVVQEANVEARRMSLFPGRDDWSRARKAGGLVTDNHEDMHGGELETSILLHAAPDVVRAVDDVDDHVASDRPHLLTLGMTGYTTSGLIGRPSLATAQKGELLLRDLATSFADHLEMLEG
jgi:creatinine amidohydrolase